MSRTFPRLLVIAIACAVALALAGGVAMATPGGKAMTRMVLTSGPVALQSGPSVTSPSNSPAATPASDSDGDNDGSAANDAQSGDQASDTASDSAQEQEISGTVASVDSVGSTFTLATGTGPVIVTVNSATRFEDGLNGLASMQQGAQVTVKGTDSAGQALATEVHGAIDSPDMGQ